MVWITFILIISDAMGSRSECQIQSPEFEFNNSDGTLILGHCRNVTSLLYSWVQNWDLGTKYNTLSLCFCEMISHNLELWIRHLDAEQ